MRRALIIGGGPAGAAAAAHIAVSGQPVTLIERTTGPTDKVCGDFLSVEAVESLLRLGVDPARLGGERIGRLRLIHGHRMAETALPFPAFGLTRRTLDEALLRQAASVGARVIRGVTARGLAASARGVTVRADPLGEVGADAVFLATGKHDLRQTARPGRTGGPVGWKMYFALSPAQREALRGCIELMLFPGGYAGLQCVEGGSAVLCLLTSQAWLAGSGAGAGGVLDAVAACCPHLRERLRGATPGLERPLAVAGLPYGYLYQPAPGHFQAERQPENVLALCFAEQIHAYARSVLRRSAPDNPDGQGAGGPAASRLFRLGDQVGVIPSFTGDGVAIALHSAALAAQAWLSGDDADAYHRRMRRHLRGQMRLASALHRGCMTPGLQPWLVRIARASPAIVRLLARSTRLRAA